MTDVTCSTTANPSPMTDDYTRLTKVTMSQRKEGGCILGGSTITIARPSTDFRTWKLDGDELVLKRREWYRIALDDCGRCSEVLDWIFHYRAKDLTPLEIADMLEALEIILRPRQNLCSFGQDIKADGKALVSAHRKVTKKKND